MPRTAQRPDFAARARTGPERRFITRDAIAEAPATEDSNLVAFRGHAIVYDEWTEIRDWWGDAWQERIARGATSRAQAEDDVRFLFNHDPNFLLARHRGEESDTLRLSDDAVGLLVEADLDARISYVQDLAVALARGDISGMSFAFEVMSESWDMRPDGQWFRTIEEVRLYDVAVVTYPAYEGTDAGLRGLLGLPDVRSIRALIEARKGRRNSTADETVIRSTAEGLRSYADELDELITDASDDEDDEDDSERTARAANEAARHRAMSAYLGMALAGTSRRE